MLQELIQELAEQVRRGDAATVVNVPGKPRAALVSQRGERQWGLLDPPLRAPKVSALSSLTAYLAPFKAGAQVFLGQSAVVALLDATDRRETVTLPLTTTDVWRRLAAMQAWTPHRPEQIVRALRDLDAPTGVIGAVRKLDFKRQSGVAATTQHGKESLGRRVEAEVQGADQIPEFFDVDAMVFVEDGCQRHVTVRVDVYLNVQQETIDLRVSADRLATATAEVLTDIADTIEASPALAGVAVFMGSP